LTKGLGGRNYPRGKALALFSRNFVIPTHKICSPFKSKGRESSRELKRGNSMRELAWGPGG